MYYSDNLSCGAYLIKSVQETHIYIILGSLSIKFGFFLSSDFQFWPPYFLSRFKSPHFRKSAI